MKRSSDYLKTYARALGISTGEIADVLRKRGVEGDFIASDMDWYVTLIEDEARARAKAERLDRPNTPAAIAARATEALKRWAGRKWLFPPIVRVGDEYCPNPYGDVEGETVYSGVLNE